MNRPFVIWGPPAAGKTTCGERLARALGREFTDLDRAIEEASGLAPAAFFAERGEAAFRELEERLLREVLSASGATNRLIAVGGGALLRRELRHYVAELAWIVALSAPVEVLAERALSGSRPLLGANCNYEEARARLVGLLDLRGDAYAEAHLTLDATEFDVDAAAASLTALATRDPLLVPAGRRSYLVDFVSNAQLCATDRIAELGPSGVVVVTDSHVARAQKKYLDGMLAPLSLSKTRVALAPGEVNKTLPAVAAIWDAALAVEESQPGLDRDAVIVAFGGGVVGDLAGFAAATLLRGIRVVQVPTSLLAMVDSSVGGKTGFDHGGGKNLVGAFHPPSAVVVDVALLETLPPREFRAGFGEMVKIGLTSDAELFEALEHAASESTEGALRAGEWLLPLIRRAVTAKMRIVRDDPEERGIRGILNFGHTFGHALETHGGFARWLHGEAVALGALVELASGIRKGVTPPELLGRTQALLQKLGLPTEIPPADHTAALRFVGLDKKRRGNTISLPQVTSLGAARLERLPLGKLDLGPQT